MEYIFEKENRNYEDFSSGRVLYNQKGTTAFPVRIASEVFLRCKKHLEDKGIDSLLTVYDPCCGGGYLLTTLGFLHGQSIARITASDIDYSAIELAKKNLALLTRQGMENRLDEINRYIEEYGKASHLGARDSAYRLYKLIEGKDVEINCFCADALRLQEGEAACFKADLVMTDFPYGDIVEWSEKSEDIGGRFLESIKAVMASHTVVAVIADKKTVVKHEAFKRVEQFNAGKRRVTILEYKKA